MKYKISPLPIIELTVKLNIKTCNITFQPSGQPAPELHYSHKQIANTLHKENLNK